MRLCVERAEWTLQCLSFWSFNVSDADSGQDVSEFNWDDYLEETGSLSVPHHAFKHVDQGLETGLTPGMKLEVCVRTESETAYWVATIITTCGQLLLLRYEGYQDDRRADFWCDIMTADLHPIGWSKQQGRPMRPPEGVREKHQDWETLLEKALAESCSVPASLLEGAQRGCNPIDLLSPGLNVELVDRQDIGVVWSAVIEENVGGRLRLRYAGTDGLPDTQSIIWVFYLDPLLHLPGWAQEHSCTLRPPAGDRSDIKPHSFTEGMKLEAVDPAAPFTISPATVAKVFNDQFFLVQMDDMRDEAQKEGCRRSFLCHRDSPGVFPTQWSLKNGVKLSPPPGSYCTFNLLLIDPFDQCIKESMMLEAVNPLCPGNIHVATVVKVKGQHMWIRLEGLKQAIPEIIVHRDSMDIFPVSWCETNGCPLHHPCKPRGQFYTTNFSMPRCCAQKLPYKLIFDIGQANGKYSCPKIYFNHRCFSGPYLNKGRIAELPQCVGPGNCVLVLKEVLTLLINSAYKPSRVLRELQLDQEGRWQGHGETLKAKYKGKSYRATVEIVRTADQVADFCRKTCIKLECCPNLFGPRMVLERCSENCSVLTKTKYTYYYGKKKCRRVGRPPGGHSNLEGGVKRRGRKRKRRKQLFVHKKRRSSASVDNTPAGSPQGSGDEEDLDEDDSLSEDTGSELQDELMDDSEYSEKKSQPTTPSPSPPETPLLTVLLSLLKSPRTEVPPKLCLDSSPLEWSVTDVVRFIRTTDCAPLARIFKDQEIDGQALLLLNLPTVQECMDLKLGPAIKLCHHIEQVKLAFYQQFSS
uniref:SAM domain-containing protein n=1 Tax=Cyprinus carpio carpio TaxID=630221 RepID=A0A8C1EFR9_CYPCA